MKTISEIVEIGNNGGINFDEPQVLVYKDFNLYVLSSGEYERLGDHFTGTVIHSGNTAHSVGKVVHTWSKSYFRPVGDVTVLFKKVENK